MIEFKNITKTYGTKKAVDDVNITIDSGSFVCFIGTSGSGKTTCMRMINRMIKPTQGQILIDGDDIQSMSEVSLRRGIGYVIQQIGLMPHMTIYENIVTVPRLLKWSEEKMYDSAVDLMGHVDLPLELFEKYPSELSGGMQQRIGVIRALAADQSIILMDEPFGALDPITRDALQKLVKHLQKTLNKTIIFVTHDMDEALTLADKIVVMDKGKVVQQGTPEMLLKDPVNDFVRNLIGEERLNQAAFEYDTVERIMIKPVKVNEDMTVGQTVRRMQETRVDDILVVDHDDKLVGRVDLYALTRRRNQHDKVSSIMKKVTYVYNTTSIRDAIYYIQDLGYRNLSVIDEEGRLVGLVTRSSIVTTVYDAFWSDYEPIESSDEVTDENGNLDKVTSASEAVGQGGDEA